MDIPHLSFQLGEVTATLTKAIQMQMQMMVTIHTREAIKTPKLQDAVEKLLEKEFNNALEEISAAKLLMEMARGALTDDP